MTMILKGCEHCGGDLVPVAYQSGLKCLQCGRPRNFDQQRLALPPRIEQHRQRYTKYRD